MTKLFILVAFLLITGCGSDNFSVREEMGGLGGEDSSGGGYAFNMRPDNSGGAPETGGNGGATIVDSAGGQPADSGGVESTGGGAGEDITPGPCAECPAWDSFRPSEPPETGSCVSWPNQLGEWRPWTFNGGAYDINCSPGGNQTSYCYPRYGNQYSQCR